MTLIHPFDPLPLHFNAAQLAYELFQLTESEWRSHPQRDQGIFTLPLLAANGGPTNENTTGPVRPTPYLDRCPYLKQGPAALEALIGRTRLTRIEGPGGRRPPRISGSKRWPYRMSAAGSTTDRRAGPGALCARRPGKWKGP